MKKTIKNLLNVILIAAAFSSCASTKQNQSSNLVIKEQGAFSAGGTVVKSDGI